MDRDLSELDRKYRDEIKPLYDEFTPKVSDLLHSVLHELAIPIAFIQHRVKTPESLIKKVNLKDYEEPFKEIQDFSGIRIITYYSDDVPKIADHLKQCFRCESKDSHDKLDDLADDAFGYRSHHLICRLDEARLNQVEWRKFKDLVFEVQIRSVLQHGWGLISHKVYYKNPNDAPRELRRNLFRLSALLELGDDEFTKIRDHSARIIAGYRAAIQQGNLNIPLNVDSLTEFVTLKLDLSKWENFGADAGMRRLQMAIEPHPDLVKNFLKTLEVLGATTLVETKALIPAKRRKLQVKLTRFTSAVEEAGRTFVAIPIDVLHLGVILEHKGLFPTRHKWPGPWHDEIKQVLSRETI